MVRFEVVGVLDADEVARRQRASSRPRPRPTASGRSPSTSMLHLRYGGDDPVRNLLAWDGDRLAAYAHLDVTDEVAGASAEVVVDPAYRRQGLGAPARRGHARRDPRRSAAALGARRATRRRRRWPRSLGFRRVPGALADAPVAVRRAARGRRCRPASTVRTFEPGRDDEAWVGLNALAFRGHPEQGGWTVDDLHRRECRAVVRPGRLLPRRRRGDEASAWSASTGPRSTAGRRTTA